MNIVKKKNDVKIIGKKVLLSCSIYYSERHKSFPKCQEQSS